MPKICNYMDDGSIIYGGAFSDKTDEVAAICCNLALLDSPCDSCVTYKVLEQTFLAPARRGDIVFMNAEIIELRDNSITVLVEAEALRRSSGSEERIKVMEAKLVFVSKIGKDFRPHRLVLKNESISS